MILDLTTKELRIVLGEAKTTTDCPIVSSWAETSSAVFLGGNTNINSNGTTPVVVVGFPSNNTVVRDVREVRLYNADTVTHTVTLQLWDGTTAWPIAPAKVSVVSGGSFIYTPEAGISVVTPTTANTGITVVDGDGTTITGVTSLTFAGPIVTGATPNATATLVPWGQLSGCSITIASTTSFTVAAGQATSSDNTTLMTLASALTKLTGGTWVAGNNQNGLDTGTIANSTWYHVYVIFNPATLVTDVLFSTNATTPSLPSGYTKFRRIGSVLTGPSTAPLVTFFQNGDRFDWAVPVIALNGALGNTTANTFVMDTPAGIVVEAMLSGYVDDPSSTQGAMYISSLAQTDEAAAAPFVTAITPTPASGTFGGFSVRVMTNTVSSARIRANTASMVAVFGTNGWIDRRGRG